MKKTLLLLSVLLSSFFLSGCLGDLMGIFCDLTGGDDHCYQAEAIQESDPYGCEKIKGESFTMSNPPKDKCYLLIAENTGDYDVCDKIVGGPMSYTKEECVIAATLKNEDPEGCKRLEGTARDNCMKQIGATVTTDKLKDISKEVEDAKSAAGANPDDEDVKKKLADLLKKQSSLFDSAPPEVRTQYFKEAREEIMSDVEDDDVKSEISKIFVDYRNKNPNATLNEQLKKMQEIKDNQDYVKNLDDQVNEVFDEMKTNITDFVSENADEATGASEFAEDMQKRGVEWFKENGGDRVKSGIANLEWAKEKYDKASEQYAQITEQIDKLKKAYDEAAAVYKKIDEVNKLVAEGRLDKGKAGVLHGAILLGKGLEYATSYVPVFGSTASKITAATFEATVKFATKRAERTTAIDKCIEDPENCDPNNISAY